MVYLSGLSVFQHTPAPTEIGQVDHFHLSSFIWLLFHKGAYPENMFCVVLLKSAGCYCCGGCLFVFVASSPSSTPPPPPLPFVF